MRSSDWSADGCASDLLASKGIHIVLPRERIKAKSGMFLRTEKSVLFIIPWQHYWVIGTTDTAWPVELQHPVPTSADIDYLLEHANSVLAQPPPRRPEARRDGNEYLSQCSTRWS